MGGGGGMGGGGSYDAGGHGGYGGMGGMGGMGGVGGSSGYGAHGATLGAGGGRASYGYASDLLSEAAPPAGRRGTGQAAPFPPPPGRAGAPVGRAPAPGATRRY